MILLPVLPCTVNPPPPVYYIYIHIYVHVLMLLQFAYLVAVTFQDNIFGASSPAWNEYMLLCKVDISALIIYC